MRQFKFKFIKRELGIDGNEKISGMPYDEFSRKSFKIMLMMITQSDIHFENPKKVHLLKLIKIVKLSMK